MDKWFISRQRRVSLCQFNRFATPLRHPDRVMKEHDIIYLLEGQWEIYQDGIAYMLTPGDVLLLRAGCHHYGSRPCETNTRTMYMHINALPGEVPGAANYEGEETFVQLDNRIPCLRYPAVKRVFEDIIHAYWSDTQDSLRLGALLDLFLCELAAAYRGILRPEDDLVKHLLYLFRMYPDRFFHVVTLAQEAHVSTRTLSNRFKIETGQSIYHYQINLKLNMAYAMLKEEPRRTLQEVAENFGFYDAFQFSRLFKAKYGFSPSRLRQQHSI